jgi:hypothetical protein
MRTVMVQILAYRLHIPFDVIRLQTSQRVPPGLAVTQRMPRSPAWQDSRTRGMMLNANNLQHLGGTQ